MNTINVGLVGFGYWGPNLARNFSIVPGCQLKYICDLDASRRDRATAFYPGARVTDNFDELLQDKEVHLILVATPVSSHYPLVKKALEAGKDVLVEKPLAFSAEQAAELVELAGKLGRMLAVDHTFLFTGAVRKIKELVDSGELGELLYFDSVRVNLGLFQHDVNVLWDLAPHDLAILSYLCDDTPKWLTAMGAAHTLSEHENQVYLHLEYDTKLVAHFHWNWLAPVKIRFTSICGTNKMVVYNDMETSEKVKVYDKGITQRTLAPDSMNKVIVDYRTGDMVAPKLRHGEALAVEAEHIIHCVRTREKPLSDGAFSLKIMRILECAEKSLRENGRRISLSPIEPGPAARSTP